MRSVQNSNNGRTTSFIEHEMRYPTRSNPSRNGYANVLAHVQAGSGEPKLDEQKWLRTCLRFADPGS